METCHSLFIENKYTKWYLNIMKRSFKRIMNDDIYYERHHMYPKAIAPQFSNLKEYPWNQRLLTPKEHFVCHALLIHMTRGKHKRQMLRAFACMKMDKIGKRYTSKLYDVFRKEFIKDQQNYARENLRKINEERKKIGDLAYFGAEEIERRSQLCREVAKKNWANNEIRAAMSKKPEDITNYKNASLNRWQDPEYKEKQRLAKIEGWKKRKNIS